MMSKSNKLFMNEVVELRAIKTMKLNSVKTFKMKKICQTDLVRVINSHQFMVIAYLLLF